MSRISLFAPAALLLAALAATAPAPAMERSATPVPDAAAQACRHYDNRARFLPRGTDAPLLARLADACALAAGALADPATPESRRATAAYFLDGLTEARAAIDAINGDRLRAAYADDVGERSGRVRDVRLAVGMVSATGEYLILRAAGVLDALPAWAAPPVAGAGHVETPPPF